MKIEVVKIDELNKAKYNPRVELKKDDRAYKQIKASMDEFGYVSPIIVNKSNMTIISGHQRVNILLDLGLTEEEMLATGFNAEEIESYSKDFIDELFNEDFTDRGKKELKEFAVTFNIDKQYEKKFNDFIKLNGKAKLIEVMIKLIESEAL